jgi:hypothetical protein
MEMVFFRGRCVSVIVAVYWGACQRYLPSFLGTYTSC